MAHVGGLVAEGLKPAAGGRNGPRRVVAQRFYILTHPDWNGVHVGPVRPHLAGPESRRAAGHGDDETHRARLGHAA